MAVRSGFFNGVNGDRRYDAKRFAEYFAAFIGNGIFPNPSTNLQVMSNNGMTITVKAGKAWIDGYILINDDDYILQIDPADGVLNRIDRIVARYDTVDREIRLEIKKGQFATYPVVPTLQRDADAYELGLADIQVNKGIIGITQANITDLRLNNNLCGIVHGTVNQVDVTTLFNQYEAKFEQKEIDFETEFNIWFDDIKNQLGDDVAGSLLNQINDLAGEGRTNETVKSAHDLAQQAFQSASDGKQVVATAITGKGVPTSSSDTFQKMATNINAIETDPSIGKTDAIASDIIKGKKAVSQGSLLTGSLELTANVLAAQVLNGFTFYKDNPKQKLTGTMPNIGKQVSRVTSKGGRQPISRGFHDGTGYIDYDDPNHIAPNIKEGVNIANVVGSLKVPIAYGRPWISRTSGIWPGRAYSVAHGNGLFVMVGTEGKLSTSPDGITWTSRTSGFGTTTIRSVAYGNGLWVIVGESGMLSTSTNGITWTPRTSGFGAHGIYSVAYGNGLWAICGRAGKLFTSPDGITWTSRTTHFDTSFSINVVAYENGLWLAGNDYGKLATSPDGITWTQWNVGFGSSSVYAIAYGNGLWVAGGQSGSLSTSPDGKTWTLRSSGAGWVSINGIAYGDGLFVITQNDGFIITSSDGINYQKVSNALSTNTMMYCVYFGNGLGIVAGDNGYLYTLS